MTPATSVALKNSRIFPNDRPLPSIRRGRFYHPTKSAATRDAFQSATAAVLISGWENPFPDEKQLETDDNSGQQIELPEQIPFHLNPACIAGFAKDRAAAVEQGAETTPFQPQAQML